MKLFSEFSGQIAWEIRQGQKLCLITFVYCVSRFVSTWPASDVVDSPFELNWALNKFWSRQKMLSRLVFDRFLFFLTSEETDCPLMRLGPK